MGTPVLADLPPPPPGRSGWPWTGASAPLPGSSSRGYNWPSISIVTPSFNQGNFLEETIRSVLLQGYPELEYIVMDGGSRDDTRAILDKYSPWLTFWESLPDRGQSHALNKGFGRATGKIHGWINSDDVYRPGLLARVGERYQASDPLRFWYVAGVEYLDQETGSSVEAFQEDWFEIDDWVLGPAQLHQQAAFWSQELWSAAGPFDEAMHHGFDKEYFAHLVALGFRYEADRSLVGATYRQHDACKWRSDRLLFQYDWARISLRYLRPGPPEYGPARLRFRSKLASLCVLRAQLPGLSRGRRLRHLAEAVSWRPAIAINRAFVGTLRRWLTGSLTP